MEDLSDIEAAIERKGFYEIADANWFLKTNFMGVNDKSKAFHSWCNENGYTSTEEWVDKVQRVRITRKRS